MFDLYKLLCCFNSRKLYCLEVTAIILTIISLILSVIDVMILLSHYSKPYFQVFTIINVAVIIYCIFLISFVFYYTNNKVVNSDKNSDFLCMSVMACVLFFYLTGSYLFISVKEIQIYLSYKKNPEYLQISKGLNNHLIIIAIISSILAFFGLILIFLWISITVRIKYKIYCSFTKSIRMLVNKNFTENKNLPENETNKQDNENNKDKKTIDGDDLVSVVIVKNKKYDSWELSSDIILANNPLDKTENKAKKIIKKNSNNISENN